MGVGEGNLQVMDGWMCVEINDNNGKFQNTPTVPTYLQVAIMV